MTEFYGVSVNGTFLEEEFATGGETAHTIESSMLEPRSMAVDTGTSLLLLDSASMAALKQFLQDNYAHLPGISGAGDTAGNSEYPSIFSASVYAPKTTCLHLPSDYDWSAWPTLDLLVDAVTISVPAPLYFIEASADTCVLFDVFLA